MYRPLADELRPEKLEDMVGQRHILGPDGLLTRIVNSGNIPNMIFYGPSGTGKTTAARIIARSTSRTLRKLNATTAGISDIKQIIDELDTFLTPGGVLLYLDEIQYFNKRQQQSLLEFIENGSITLIAATTENPYFYIFNAILSRSTVFEFKQVSAGEIAPAVERAISYLEKRDGVEIKPEPGVVEAIASGSGGDVRKAINAVELLYSSAVRENGAVLISLGDARAVSQRSAMRYDRDGDEHYDIISPCRRLLVIAAEDIGLDYPQAIHIVKACVDSAMQLGYPEARIPLADAVVLLATAPKSNSAYMGIDSALADVKKGRTGAIPRELQNKHADGTGFERDQGYKYPHDFPNHYVEQQYLPDTLSSARYYKFGDNKNEQAARQYWEKIKGGS